MFFPEETSTPSALCSTFSSRYRLGPPHCSTERKAGTCRCCITSNLKSRRGSVNVRGGAVRYATPQSLHHIRTTCTATSTPTTFFERALSPVGDMKVSTPRLALNPLALSLLLFFSPASADPAPVTDLTTTVAASSAGDGGLGLSYNEGLASVIVRLTEAAYCTPQLASWSCKACQHFPGMRNVTVINGEKRNVRGFVGVDIGDGEASNRYTSTTRGPDPDDRRHLRAAEGDDRGAGGAARSDKPRIVITFSGTDPSSVKVCSLECNIHRLLRCWLVPWG